MIDYSIFVYNQKFGKKPGLKAYGRAQCRETLGLDEIAAHISSHNSKYSEGDIHAVLVELVNCTHEFILDGYKVELGRLGAFYPTLRCTPAQTIADFTADNIKDVTVSWTRGTMFKSLRNEAHFNYTPSRADQAALKKAVKKGSTVVDLSKPEKPAQNGTNQTVTPEATNVTVTAASNNETFGTVTGGGTYVKGATVTLQASPASGYKFDKWQDGTTANPRQITADSDVTFTATFVTAGSTSGGMMGD